ncbi:MAG: hypothetical protein ACE5I7_19505 [Candidatus Binatia bacterium]
MRNGCHVWCCGLSATLILGLSACAARAPLPGPTGVPEAYPPTAVPTVPPSPPTPVSTPAPLPTRPIGRKVKARKGHPIGPIVTFFGAARADGSSVEPERVDAKGIPTYLSHVGSGFMLVVEVKPGESGYEPGRRVFAYVPDDPSVRPDLEIETNRDMGDGSRVVCDRRRPNIGGIPAINPPSFAERKPISDAINDFSCRFETFTESESACTLNQYGDYSFVKKDSTTQFCMIVARAYLFPVGKTLLSVRVRDSEGHPGPVKRMWIDRPRTPPVRKKKS